MKGLIFTKRAFAKFAKGGYGRESTLSNNFSFPKHKEAFNQEFFEGDERSAVSDMMNEKDPIFDDDEFGVSGGGILNHYRRAGSSGQAL